MTAEFEELRKEIASSQGGQTRWYCPLPLRQKIVDFARARNRGGVSLRKVARELGVSESGLLRWVRAEKGQLRPVRVAEEPASRASLVLVTPDGYRLEGLNASSAADVLRRLGC